MDVIKHVLKAGNKTKRIKNNKKHLRTYGMSKITAI